VLAHQRVLDKTSSHTYGRDTKAPVEALPAPHSGGKNRSNQRTDVNAHIEDGETTITAWISLGVQRAEHNLRGSFHATGTNGNQNKTMPRPGIPGITARAMWPNMTITAE